LNKKTNLPKNILKDKNMLEKLKNNIVRSMSVQCYDGTAENLAQLELGDMRLSIFPGGQ